MNSNTSLTTSPKPKRPMGVVAVALMEKLQKSNVVLKNLTREQGIQRAAADELAKRIADVESEIAELSEALSDYEVPSEQPLGEDEGARWTREQKRYTQVEGRIPTADLYPESRQQKQAVIAEVKGMLEKMGSMHLREIHRVLRTSGIEVPSLTRLSQILSESEEFQADRSIGWSLKGERPGLGQPGLSGSQTTSSGDES